MRTLLSTFFLAFTLIASGQDTLKSESIKGIENFVETRFGKYKGQEFPDFVVTKSGMSTFSNKDRDY